MNLHEYQTKALFAQHGIPVPKGKVAATPQEAAQAFQQLGVARAAVKIQIHAGGRGKAGGIKVVTSAAEAESAARTMLGKTFVTYQTGPAGKPCNRVLVEEAVEAQREIYVGITLDRRRATPVLMTSKEGGMDIEEIAKNKPESILIEPLDAFAGLRGFQARKLAVKLEIPDAHFNTAASTLVALSKLYLSKDATLIEVNPWAITKDGRLMALDGKINVDDRAHFRQKEAFELADASQEDPTEHAAHKAGLSYVSMEGNIACMVNGAGLAMSTMDIIKYAGGMPANFLDVGGGANKDQIVTAFKLLLSNKNVKAVLINIFGGILKCDVLAQGIVDAAKEASIGVPIVVRLEGTNVEQGRKILAESGLKITTAADMGDAAAKAVAAAGLAP